MVTSRTKVGENLYISYTLWAVKMRASGFGKGMMAFKIHIGPIAMGERLPLSCVGLATIVRNPQGYIYIRTRASA